MFPEVTDTLIYGARTNRWAYAKYGCPYRIHCDSDKLIQPYF